MGEKNHTKKTRKENQSKQPSAQLQPAVGALSFAFLAVPEIVFEGNNNTNNNSIKLRIIFFYVLLVLKIQNIFLSALTFYQSPQHDSVC